MKIYDAHAHLYNDIEGLCKDTVLKAEQMYGISRFYISTLDGLKVYPDEECVAQCNRHTAQFMKERPDLIRGMIYLNTKNANMLDELKRNVELGFSGVKLWISQLCDDPSVYPLAEKLIELDMPMLLHVFYKSFGQEPYECRSNHVANLAKRYPELKIIMAHLGGEVFHGMRAIKDCPNVYVDNSGSRAGGVDLTYAVKMVGADRLLYGSDCAIDTAPSLGQMLEVDVTEEEREAMLWKNAHKLFKEDQR